MKKIMSILSIGFLIISGFGAVGLTDNNEKFNVQINKINISDLSVVEENQFLSIKIDESTSEIREYGKPVIPVITKVYDFPSDTKIQNIEVKFSDIIEIPLSKPVIPAKKSIPRMSKVDFASELIQDQDIYKSSNLFPEKKWDSKILYGLKNNKEVVYVSIQINPIQYNPLNSKVIFSKNAEIKISYNQNPKQNNFVEEYDLLIIAPKKFSDNLDPLVEHKKNYGVETFLKTTEEIFSNYNSGRDNAEKIKLCIYDMKETYNISYVLLVGGRIGQLWSWYIPERVVWNDDGWEAGYSSDLYYADIYKNNGTEFEDWDSNGNGIFGEFYTPNGIDIIDYVPDVALGRLACRNQFEVNHLVKKIINYESGACDPSWFKKMICVAGDTFVPGINGDNSGIFEGEIECDHAASFLQPNGFTIEKLYTSDGSFSRPLDVIRSINRGAGFILFSGHGTPAGWGNHPPEDDNFTTGLQLYHMPTLGNGEKLPIVIVGGCHNSQFNVTLLNMIKGLFSEGLDYFNLSGGSFWHKTWVIECWSWWLVRNIGGGSIATIGCTGLGYGDLGNATLTHRGGWLDSRFFHCYGNQSIDILGDVHSQTITDYINIIGGENTRQLDRKSIEEWVLLGDPSLKIGGYP